jgi:hypothetical protein
MRTACAALAVAVLALAAGAGGSRAAAPSPVLVTLQQVGGFAGIERSLLVRRNGRVESDGLVLTTRRLSPARLQALRQALVAARFATLKSFYRSDPPIADGYVYRVGYGARRVAVEEGAKTPPRLARLLTQLARLARGLTIQ